MRAVTAECRHGVGRTSRRRPAVDRGHIDAATAKAILNGTSLVEVTVCRDATTQVSVDVKSLHGGEAIMEKSS